MNVLLITIAWPQVGEYNLYSDLAQEFYENGNKVTVVALNERTNQQKTYISFEDNIQVLRVMTGKIQKINKYLKVIFSFLAGPQIIYQMQKYFKKEKLDLIIFTTPPITLSPSIILIKKRYHSKLYLLLKDIWPQDAVDLGEMRKGGIVWRVFRFLEKITYKNADYIGCMSDANVAFIRRNNAYLKNKVIEVCPNSEKIRNHERINRDLIREKYDLPKDKMIFAYGGNLGKAQGVDFLIDIIGHYQEMSFFYFLIIGAGTEYNYLYNSINGIYPNAKILPWIKKKEFINLVQACDVGLILLNKNSSVPNFPSRLLTYLTAKIPIISVTDNVTDIGDIIETAGCGAKAYNGDIYSFDLAVEKVIASQKCSGLMGENGYNLFLEKYTTTESYNVIMSHFTSNDLAEIDAKTHTETNDTKTNDIKTNEVKTTGLQINIHTVNVMTNNQVLHKIEVIMKTIKRFILTHIFELINFICYGDLPTSYYLKRGMKIGCNFFRQTGTKFDPSHCYLIKIGDNVTVANNVQFLAHDQSTRVYLGYGKVGKIDIGNNVFIGAKTLILPNVRIGDNVIIGAGSVVTKSIPENSVAVGVPAQIIGNTDTYISKCSAQIIESQKFDRSYINNKKLSDSKKAEIVDACQNGFAYIELGKVIDYGRRKS